MNPVKYKLRILGSDIKKDNIYLGLTDLDLQSTILMESTNSVSDFVQMQKNN